VTGLGAPVAGAPWKGARRHGGVGRLRVTGGSEIGTGRDTLAVVPTLPDGAAV
jgi:hypothetical protein